MTSVEKRRSGRKSGGHRKHSDGGYSDTSSCGSFLDETDREVSNLTDRAFRSLCIGDEAVYNDSDLSSSSPCVQRDRQLAFSQSGQDRERRDLKRAAHMQQYGQDWINRGMYGAEIQRDPQWEVYGERTQGRVSATFQQSFVETSEQGESLGEAELPLLSNGEFSSQQRRSRSRVSSLIRAFNSEGQRDGAGMNDILSERNDETSWDKSALMSIRRELSEFSTSYQQNTNSGHFPSAGSFSCQDTNIYSSEVAAVAHMNSASSFMRASHSKHSMSTQVNSNSNFFIHSEFSPFKVWRDHNRFPFQQGEISGYMHCSEFPKWYQTPMYRELSLETQPQGPYRFEERGVRYPRNNLSPMVPPTLPRSTSTSTMLQKASAVEKRCESELTGHYPHRKRTQSLGTNRLPSQRPSTASPTSEMSRRVQDTISSVRALQQKIKMMTEQNFMTGMTANQQGVFCATDNFIPFSNDAKTVAPNVSCNSSMPPFNMSQQLTPSIHAPQETETSEVRQYAVSPQPVEHPPVQAESRGATPDVRMSTYKSRATNLLFNLKDNRKRVKSTYSPAKFKVLEMEKNKEASMQEPRDTVIDIPEFPDFFQGEDSSRTNAASHQHVNQYPSPGLLLTTNSQPAHAGQYSEYTDYQTAQMQSEMVHNSGFTPGNFASNQPTNGLNLYEDSSSLTPYQQGMIHNVDTQGGDLYRLKPSYTATETQRQNADKNQHREYLISKANAEQHFNETVGWEFTKVDKYQQLKENKHDYSNVSSQDRWKKTNSKDADNLSVKDFAPWKQEMTALLEKDQHAEAYQRAELNSQRDKYRGENISKELPQNTPFSDDARENPAYFGQSGEGIHAHQNYYGHNEENEIKLNNYLTQRCNRYTDQEHRNQRTVYHNKDKSMLVQETGQKKQHTPIHKMYEMQSPQPTEIKPQFEHNVNKNALSNPYNASAPTMENQVKDRQFVEVEAGQVMVDHIKAQHTQAELAKAQHWAQVEQPRPESARLILARQTGSEKVKAEEDLTDENRLNQIKTERIKEEKKQEEEFREKQPEHSREEWTKSEQTRAKKVTEEPRHMKEEAGAEHLRQGQGEPLKAKRPEAERLKEELIKTEAAKTEQARLEQVKSEQVRRERVKAEQTKEEQLRAKQDEREQMEAEQIRTEKVKIEKADAEHKKAEQAKLDQIQAEQEKTRIAEAGKVKADQMQVEHVKQGKTEGDSGQAGRANAEQPTAQIRKAEERKGEQVKLEQTKVDLSKAELTKTEQMQDKFAKHKLTITQQIKSEPDKVMQVKTELAKAKAELAKIKEKMREQQKGRHTVPTKEDGRKTDVALKVNNNKNEADKDQEQATQMPQQREDSVVVSRQYPEQANITLRGIDEYERLREKYGFTDTNSQNRNYVSAAGKDSSNANETAFVSLDKVETKNNEKSKDKLSLTSQVVTANTENMEDVSSFKHSGLTESQYVYSESSKEFKLSGNYLPKNADKRANTDIVTDKGTNDIVDKLEKRSDISQQRDLDMAKPLPLEKKPKSTEHSVGPGRDQHISPPRVLSHKERSQTKQEILTSKIKAHAEKEISAIKEKGFAVRDGFISKNSTKQLSGSQSHNVRQRPPSQDASKKHDSTMSCKIIPKHQMEPSGIQKVPKEPMKSNDNEPKPQKGAQHTDEGWEDKKNETQSEIRSPKQSNEQKKQEQQGAYQGENSGKQKEGLKDNPVITTDHFNKKTGGPSQGTALDQAETSKPMRTEKAENKHEVIHEYSAPLLSLVFGQNKTSVFDDSLQITGIMVTVRENKPSEDNDQRNDNSQMNVKEKECSTSEIEQCHSSSGLEASKGNIMSKEVSIVKPKDGVDLNNHPENTEENSTLKTSENNVSQTVSVTTNPQQDSSSTEARPQRVTQAQEALTEKGVPSTVTVLAKNKVLAETQPLLYKQDPMIETKDYTNETAQENLSKSIRKDEATSTEENSPQNRQTAHNNDNFTAKMVTTTIRCMNDSYRAESLINQPSAKEDMTTGINASKSRNIDGKSAPLVEEKRCQSTPPKPVNTTSTSNQEARIGENNEVDDNVHIGSIAIRVVPSASKKDNLKMAETYQVTSVPSDGANKQKQVSTLSVVENVKTLNNEDRTKDLSPKSSDKQVKDGLAEECMLFSVRKLSDSPKIDNQQKSINTTTQHSEDTQDKNEKPEEVHNSGKSIDESKIQPMVEDYFQVQGMAETNNVPHRQTSDAVSKGRGLPGSPLNEAAISDESCHERKHEAFMLDQSKRKTVKSSSARVQDEDMKRKIRETKESLVSEQNNCPTERQSNKNEKTDVGQAVRKQQRTENPSVLSRERQSSRNSHPRKENIGKEKAEVKPKPKERVTTIPEISAIADYARLKVIVSEDEANTSQEFPPSKKEGFFPLIQTRHSRRPVFTADPQDLSVKEKHLPNNTEVFSKVNKEPKPLVFPITEKEHQRTGMFKLGDKERQEKMHLGVNENVLDTGAKHVQQLKEQNKLPTSHLKNQGNEEWSGIQNVRQEEQSFHHPSKQAATSSSAVNRPKSNSASLHQKLPENPHEKLVVEVNNTEENTTALAKTGEERSEKNTLEGAQQQSSAKASEEKQASRIEEERRAEERVKHMIEETRASLAEEERRAAQREEERRAREREAIAIKIKERREKQRRAETRAEEERAAQKEEERRANQREEDRKKKETEERRINITKEEHRAQEEQQRSAAHEEQQKRAVQEERMRRAAKEKQQRRVVQEEQLRRAAQEEHQRRAVQEEQLRRAAQEAHQRRAVQEEQLKRAVQEEQSRAAQEEQQRRVVQEEQLRRAAHEKQQWRATQEEQKKRAVQEEQLRRAAQEEQQRRAVQEEQLKRAAQEEQRRAAQEEQQRRAVQGEQLRRTAQEEQQRRAVQEEQLKRAAQEEQRRAAQEEQQRRVVQEEQLRRAAQEEQQRRVVQEEQLRRAAQEEQQRRAVQEEQLKRAAQEEQMRAAQEEQRRRAVQEEQLRRAAQEEHRRAAQEEKQRRAVQEEQLRRTAQEEQMRAAQEEQQRRAAQEEQQRRALQEEQLRRVAQEEQQRRAAQEEQRRAAQEEQQRRAVQEEQLRRVAQEEQQRRAAQEEQRRVAQEEQQRRAAQEEQRRAAQEEQQRRAAQEEQLRRAAQEEQQRRAAQEEQLRRAAQEEQRRAAQEEQQRRAAQEEPRRAVLIEEKRQAKHKEEKIFADIEEKKRGKQREEEKSTHISEEERIEEQKKAAREQMLAQREEVIRAKQREEDEKLAAHREKIDPEMGEQKGAAQRMDTLQYYAITSTEPAQEPRERQLCSPLPSQQRHNPSGLEDSGSHRPHRPQAPASPAPSLSRSNTSSPALGVKPSMFRVKDNTFRGSSLTKSVKPRLHKTFGEDLRAGSPMERASERGEEDQEIMRRSAGTPVYPDTGLNRLATIKESSTFRSAYSTQDHKARPYSRRSIALDEDDSRSIISNMSEDVESFAISVADLTDLRSLHDYERPESACSFSSDVSRSLGKPPTVPPKSEKALRRAQRLTTRRIKKELSKLGADSPAGVEKSLQEVSSGPSSSSTEVRSSSRQAVASPHFSPPVSLAHAPTLGSSLPSSHPESSHSSFSASPHATGPISLPVASPHATAPISLPVASLNVTGSASHTVVPMTVAHVPSSPTLHHATHPAPVTQYHVESSYPHSYPLTQRKVLQDLGSGQYFVVDVPVQVKTKTFIDPETGKYVQLNVRESGQSTSRLHPQQTYPQSQLQQPQPTPASKPFALYQGNHGYPQDYQPQTVNSVPCNRTATPSTLHQGQQPARESHSYGHPAPETGQNSEVHRYSPEKTPYMDTFNDKDKTYNTVYNTHGPYESLLECDTNSQLAKSPVCENENSAHSQCQPRDIITMSELEDFMEVSDW